MQPSESAEQIALVKRCRAEGIFIFSIPNGVNLSGCGKSKYKEIEKLKAEGLTRGAPDLFLPEYKLFIELKRRHGGVASKEQLEVQSKLTKFGYTVEICHGAASAWQVIKEKKDAITTDNG